MKFNRVREMTDQVEALKFALQFENEKARSDGGVVLELNRDKTAVRRTNSIHFEPADDVDERTLYIVSRRCVHVDPDAWNARSLPHLT